MLQSDRYIAVRTSTILQCITVSTPPSIMKLPVSVDAAVMHPTQKLIALRSAAQLQVYNLEMKTKIAATMMDMPHGDTIMFWKYIHDHTIMIVTTTSVYHWTTHSPTHAHTAHGHGHAQYRSAPPPLRIFDRLPPDNTNNDASSSSQYMNTVNQQQVVNGGCSDDGQWHFVVSLSSRHGGGIRGHLHIYNSELAASQPEIVCAPQIFGDETKLTPLLLIAT